MSSESFETEQALAEATLRQQVKQFEQALDNLDRELQAVDVELDELAQKKRQYDLLSQVCDSLQELDGLGAADLFWGKHADAEQQHDRLQNAQHEIEGFGKEIARVEDWRQDIVEKMDEQNQKLDYLHYELLDAVEREEKRKYAWLIEREADETEHRAQIMPWARGCEEDQRFRRSLGSSLAASLAIALLISMIAVPIAQRSTVNELPERVAKLVREERPLPPPVEPVMEPLMAEEDPPEPDPTMVEEPPPQELPESIEEPKLAQTTAPSTKERVKTKGILAFRDSFADRANLQPTARLGSHPVYLSLGSKLVTHFSLLLLWASWPLRL